MKNGVYYLMLQLHLKLLPHATGDNTYVQAFFEEGI